LALELLPDPALQLDANQLLAGEPQELSKSEWALFKSRWGAFYNTRLEDQLRRLNATTVVFAGCNFPNCPRTSIYEASERDFRVVAVSDGISGFYEIGHRELINIGVSVMTTDSVISELAADP
jgi:nicotinamidase-related amidase